MADPAICLGDAICFFAEDVSGFAFSRTNSSAYSWVAVRAKDDRVQPRISDCQTITFRLRNANRYKLQKAYAKLLEKLQSSPNDMKLKAEVAAAKEAAKAESEDNNSEQRRLSGKRIVYGQVIQLEHSFSGKMVHASSRNTAITESSNMRIFLAEENDKTAHFRIMPRYKVKAEGDLIQVDDQVVLESMKSLGQYLHVSRSTFGSLCPVYSDSHELNISVRSSGFSIYRHYKWKESEENQLKAGRPFRLFHAELEAYMVASGVFGEKDLTEEVHLRIRNQDPNQPRTMVPPTSAITYWQLEFNEGTVRGDVVKWQNQVRLKHMCTQRYLKIDDNRKVGLTDQHADPLTVFKLHPVIKEREEIECSTFCRISHVVTGVWLSGSREEYKSLAERKVKNAGGGSSSMASLRWSAAALKQIAVNDEMRYDDAFTIQPVEPVNLANFNYMSGIVPIIQMVIQLASANNPVAPLEEERIMSTMKEISQFMVVNSEPSKPRQKLLRNLQVVELFVRLLQRPVRGSPNANFLTKVFLEAYNALRVYLLGDSRKNELYMAQHIDFFKNQISFEGEIGLNAAYMVTELILDNRKLVDRIPQSYIDDIIGILMERKHERYLKFLEVLCVCDGKSIPDNQRYICNKWLMGKKKSCVFHTEVGQAIGMEKDVVYVSLDNKHSWNTLRNFAKQYKMAQEGNDPTTGQPVDTTVRRISNSRRRRLGMKSMPVEQVVKNFEFLVNQLELFGRLCQGRNEFCINVITRELGYLTWEEAFLCLSDSHLPDEVRAKYCEVIINLFIDVGDQTSVLDQITLTFVYDDIPARHRCKQIPSMSKSAVDPDAGKHIELIRRWIAGYLDDHKDMTASLVGQNNLIAQVLRLLQYLVLFGYYNRIADLRTLIGPLLSLTDGRNDKPCPPEASGGGRDEFARVKEYYQRVERYLPSAETKAIVDAKMEAMEVLGLLFNFRFNIRLQRFISEFKHTHSSAHSLHASSDLAPLLYESYDIDNDITTNSNARRVLEEMFAESDYFSNTGLVDIVMDLSHYRYDSMVTSSMWLVHRYYSAHTMLFKRAVTAQVLITDASIEVFRMLEENLPIVRRLIGSRMSDNQVEVMNKILNQLTSICFLEDNPMEPHPMNQTILYNSGIVQDILDLVTQELDIQLLEQYSGMRSVIEKSFELLRLLAVANSIVQRRLFDRLDNLLEVKGAETCLAEALTEVFTGNKETCMKILPAQIRTIMDLVAYHTHRVPQFLELLNAVVKVEELNLPLKRNQAYVMTYFMQYRSEIAYPLDVELTAVRKQLGGKSRNNEVIYTISLVNLLATCAEGENRYIESINQTIFTYSDLVAIINDPNICNHFKKSFMRFLLWVYLNTAGGLAESGAADINHDADVWSLLSCLAKEAKRIRDFAEKCPAVVRPLLRKEPTTRDVLQSKNEEIREIHETLFYFLDAVLPFLQVFFQVCFEKDLEEHASEMEVVDELASNFLDLSDVLLPMMDNALNIERMIGAIRAVLSVSTLEQKRIEEFHDKTKRIHVQEIESDERKRYEEYYSMEEELNAQLNVFAVNFSVIYGGANTIAAQIGGLSQEEYTKIGSDVELPLGREFQDHVACFIDVHARDFAGMYKMASKLVAQLRISSNRTLMNEKQRQEQEDLDIKCLQLLRGIVHNTRVQLPDDEDRRNLLTKAFMVRMEELRKIQVALNSYDAILRVLPMLSKPSDDIVREVLAFLVDMLYGGNVDVQASLYAYFAGVREERFFFAIRNRMQLSSVAYKEKRILLAQHQAKLDEAKQQMKNLQQVLVDGRRRATIVKQLTKSSASSLRKRLMGSSMMRSGRQGSKASVRPQSISSMVSFDRPNGHGSKVHPLKLEVDASDLNDDMVDLMEEVDNSESFAESMDLDFKDDGYVELVLRVLAYMCDGQNKDLQDYLREQPDNIKSVNLIAEVTKFLFVIYTTINPNSLDLIIQVFDTLVEFGSGNHENQAVIYENKICDYINFILRSQKQLNQCGLEGEFKLKLAIGQLIFVLIEENVTNDSLNSSAVDDSDASVATNMMVALDPDVITNTFVRVYQLIQDRRELDALEPETREMIANVGFRYFHLLLRMMDLDVSKSRLTKEKLLRGSNEEEEAAWNFYEKQTQSVEILKDNVIQKVYFSVKDESILREEVKDVFKYEVDRTSPSTKLRDLVTWSKEIIKDIKYQRKITSNFVGAFLVRGWLAFNIIAILLSVIIAIVVLASWVEDTRSELIILPVRANWSIYTILGLGILHNIISFFIIISFFLTYHVRLPKRSDCFAFLRKILTCGLYTGESEERDSKIGVDLFSFSTFYYLVFFGMSIGGSFTHGYLFAFHLLHIAPFNQMLKRVIQAVTRNGITLIWVFVYSLTFFYIYGLISFAYLRGQIKQDDGNFCSNMWRCFISVVHRGLVFGLYDNNFVTTPVGYNYTWYLGKFFFDLTAFIILTTIGLNIVFGVIVDTFSELRNSKWSIDNDIATICFICSRNSHDFEHQPGGFETHRRDEHNEWSYLFYFIHLDETHPNDYTGLEMYVANLYRRDQINFFPIHRSLSLQFSEEDELEDKIDRLIAHTEFLVNKKNEREKLKAREEEEKRQEAWEKIHRGPNRRGSILGAQR